MGWLELLDRPQRWSVRVELVMLLFITVVLECKFLRSLFCVDTAIERIAWTSAHHTLNGTCNQPLQWLMQ